MDSANSWWASLSGIWKAIAAVLGALAAIAAAWRPVIAFVTWCMESYDSKVLDCLQNAEKQAHHAVGSRPIIVQPLFLQAIATDIGRSDKCVAKSLRRLEKQGKVREIRPGQWSSVAAPTLDSAVGRTRRGRLSRGRF